MFSKGLAEGISISTSHKYKGLEKPVVIVMDAVARSYPLIHPDWAFSRILGDSPDRIAKEERRLFYVALTRAIDKLFIVTERQSYSPFIEEVAKTMRLAKIDWSEFPAVKSKSMRLLVQVGNQEGRGISPTFAIKDQLKASGYQWQSTGSTGWTKGFQANGFDISRVQGEVWASAADGIEVRILDESEGVVARFVVDAGTWVCTLDNLASVQAADDVA
ncbi:ATP-binding domain-containing protein [Ottowia beijingensis]|uniref:DNA 3'-5' helicase II n=1 Tax=Ottowia beijingensis TaxID=1207057 RepID=A0A853IY69_9BURK|nr:3'-5' exonuclease [Ottowia beijingensis]NZA02990.1 ATP-binding domain-containing protein [Ottowia beijingensis]